MRALSSLPMRQISTTNAVKKALKAVTAEHEHEQSTYAIDDSFQPFLIQSGFRLTENETTPQVTLQKTVEDRNIEVTFLARSPESQLDEEGNEVEQDENTNPNFVDFQVSIQKPNHKSTMVIECSASQGEVNISGLMFTKDLEKLDRSNIYMSAKEYRGPDFSTLDEKMQSSLVDYLDSLGIDDTLSQFIESYSLDKEQRLYMEWLGNLKNFLS